MRSSRAIVVLGMHRNGTSLVTRGLQSLGVCLGDDFLETRPDNPTGYWENRPIKEINDRVFAAFGLKWESIALIKEDQWDEPALKPLALEAIAYLQDQFLRHPLWGFKDPRTIRLLPFWRPIFQSLDIDDAYLVVIRNPLSVVSSLRERQGMAPLDSHLLWLLYMVPNLNRIADRRFLVTDYDLLMADPRKQIERIAHRLNINVNDVNRTEVDSFADSFVDTRLRHSIFGPNDFDTIAHVSPLSRQVYHRLHQLATDRIEKVDARFWTAWEHLRGSVEALIAQPITTDKTPAAEGS
jgi:hypothetical protein